MGVSTINPVNLLPAVPGIVLGIAMLVIARSERIGRCPVAIGLHRIDPDQP